MPDLPGRCVIKDWHGITYDAIGDSQAREAVAIINDYLFQLSPGIGRITKGLLPNSSGTAIVPPGLSDFLYKPGILGGQIAHGGTAAGDNLTLRSTAHTTKGFVYLGSSSGLSYDETNVRVGLEVASPDAKLHMAVGDEPSEIESVPTDSSIGTFTGLVGGATLHAVLPTNDGATSFGRSGAGNTPSTCNVQYAFTAPGAITGLKLRAYIRKFIDVGGSNPTTIGTTLFEVFDGPIGGPNSTIVSAADSWLSTTNTADFEIKEFTFTSGQAAAFTQGIYYVRLVINGSGGSAFDQAHTFLDITQLVFVIPSTGGGDETLQVWETPTYRNDLDFTADGGSAVDLTLSGDAPLRISAGGGTSGLRMLTSSTNGRIEVGTAAQANMNLVLSGARDATGTLLTAKFSNTTLTGTITIAGGSPAVGDVLSATNTSGLADWVTFSSLLDDDLEEIAALNNVQGDMLYTDATPAWALLAKDTNATRYLSNTGASNAPLWAQVNLANGITGDLPFANLTQIEGLSVLGTSTTGAALDVGAITAAAANNVLRVSGSGTVLGFGAINLAGGTNAVSGSLPVLNGGTGANLSATGGTSQYVKQVSAGAAFSVGTIPASDIASGAALTKTDDSNVTLTLGGSPTTALLAATSLTLGWTGDLPFSRLAQGDALSVLGVTGNATADVASIAAGADHRVLRRSGTAVAFGAINLASTEAVTGVLPAANLGTHTHASSSQGGDSLTPASLVVKDNAAFIIQDEVDPTITVRFTLEASSAGADLTLAWRGTADRTVHLPNATGTIVTWDAGTDSMQPDNGSLLLGTGPTTPMTLVPVPSVTGLPLMSNGGNPDFLDPIFFDNGFKLLDNTTPSKTLVFSLSGSSANADGTIATVFTTDKTVTIPDITGTLMSLAGDQTVTGIKTLDIPNGGGLVFSNVFAGGANVFDILDTGTGETLSLGVSDAIGATASLTFPAAGGTALTDVSTNTVTNKRIDTLKVGTATSGSPVITGNGADPPASGFMGKVAKTAQAAAIAATNITNTTGTGRYRVVYYLSCTTANVTDGTLTFQINYTDRVGATNQVTATTLTLAATSTGTTALKGEFELYKASGEISYQTNLTGAQTTSRYSVDARCEFLG